MPISSKISTDKSILKVDNLSKSTFTMTITADIIVPEGTNPPDIQNDKYEFTTTPKPGNLAAAKGSTLTASIIATQDPTKFQATATVIGIAYGACIISGKKAGTSTEWAPQNTPTVEIVPTQTEIKITQLPQPALQTNKTPGTPTTPNSTTFMEVLVTDKQGAPVNGINVDFIIANVRSNPQKQTGIFYGSDSKQLTPRFTTATSDAIVSQVTDDKGKAKIYIGTNPNPGYLSINVSAGTKQTYGGFIYIYNDEPGTESPPPLTYISGTVTDQTFPVLVQNSFINPDEFIGVFLNSKFQAQVQGKKLLQGNKENILANTSDLIVKDETTPATNSLIGRRTSNGDLINSQEFDFPIYGPLPDPKPKNQILGPLAIPNGGVINLGSIFSPDGDPEDYTTIINLENDIGILNTKIQYTAVAGDTIHLHATFQGDYKADDDFKKQSFTYPKTITDQDLKNKTFNIVIPFADISGYGTPKEIGKVNKYSMYYEYIPNGQTTSIASSSVTQGVLSTRTI